MKYAVLFIALLFAGCGGGSSTVGYEIEIDGGTVQVAKEDFFLKRDWDDANSACENLGDGWRLPSLSEFEKMYELHRQGKGNFENDFYWCRSEFSQNEAVAVDFSSYGEFDYYLKNKNNFRVRAVRYKP